MNGNSAVPVNKLQQELKKRHPFVDQEQEALLNLVRTADQIQIRFERLFRQFGLTPAQYNILRILRGEGRPLPILEIANRMITVVPGITGLIDRLEKAGLVERHRCVQDRRVIYVALCEAALAKLTDLDEPVTALHREVMQPLSNSEQQQLIQLLERLRNGNTPSSE